MTSAAPMLEIYDPGDVATAGGMSPNAVLKTACDAAYQQGLRDGRKACRSTREAEISARLSVIAEAAADFSVGHAEAREAVIRSLEPLIRAMTGSVLPDCAARGLGDELAAQVARLANDIDAPEIRVFVTPDNAGNIGTILRRRGIAAKVLSDPGLTGAKVRIRAGEDAELFDTDAAIKQLHARVESFFEAVKQAGEYAG